MQKLQADIIRKQELAKQQHKEIDEYDEKTLRYFSYIELHCQQYLKGVVDAERFLFRGIGYKKQDDAFIGNPKEDREPKDSSPEAQRLVDGAISMLGGKALRGNSIFTSSSYSQAENYGQVYIIFPVDGFNFMWSKIEHDLVLDHIPDIIHRAKLPNALAAAFDEGEAIDNYQNIVEDLDYFINDTVWAILDNLTPAIKTALKLPKGTDESKDIIAAAVKKISATPAWKKLQAAYRTYERIDPWSSKITAKDIHAAYVGLVEAYMPIQKVLPYLAAASLKRMVTKYESAKQMANGIALTKPIAQKIVNAYGFTDKDLVGALKSGNEVCIKGNYLALEYSKFFKQAKNYFILGQKPAKKPAVKKAPAKKK